ncbi:adenosine receptor A1-like [Clytia hemisphaerica]|uniref:adenosine receptor A1-like n=1 Tax=Clytia hemisphaerica TaxID=252671 RepID=UPI0034D44125
MTSTSSLTIIMLAAIKYLKISRTSTFNDLITEKRLWILIVLCWFVPAFPMLINVILGNVLNNYISFAITITTIISLPVLYLMILCVFKKSRKLVAVRANSTIQRELNAQVTERISKKLVRRSLWLIGVYFACTCLTIFSHTLYACGVIESGYLYQITNLIFLGNSCANPCIYMFKDKKSV